MAVAGIAGVLGGAALGAGSRVVMRVFAILVGQPTEFTVGGSLGLVVFGAIFGLAGGLVYVVVRRFVPGPWPVPGLAFGLALVGLVLATMGGAGSEGSADPGLATRLFAGLALAYGVFTAWLAQLVERRLAAAGWTHDGWPAVGELVSLGGVLLIALGVIGLVGELVQAVARL
jgi:hypothetical protein